MYSHWEANVSSEKLREQMSSTTGAGTQQGARATRSTSKVGCRGLVDSKSLQHLFVLAQTSFEVLKTLASQLVQTVTEESHTIWAFKTNNLH